MSLAPPESSSSAPPAAAPGPVPRGWWHGWWRLCGRWAAQGLFWGASLLLAGWLILHWGLLPRLEGWRPQIEERASRALGVPVHIGAIAVDGRGWLPAIDLRDVRVLDAQGRVALRLPQVRAVPSPRSLLTFTPQFAQLHVVGAELDVRRDALGHLRIGGLDLSTRRGAAAASDDGTAAADAADWFFRQSEFVVRGARLRWTDERRLAPPVALDAVDLVVRNGLRRHDVRLDATPPPGWGQRFTLRGRFTQELLARPSEWRRWSGTLYASLPHADLQRLRRHVDLPVELQEGDGALRAWIDVRRAVVQAATVDVALREVSVRLATPLEPLSLSQVEGRLAARRGADAWSLELRRFGFTADGDRVWPRSDVSLQVRQRQDPAGATAFAEPVTGGEFEAERLDLGVLADLAAQLPLGAAVHRALAELQPEGLVTRLSGRWDGPPDAPFRYRLALQAEGLALAPGRPSPASADTGDAHPLGRPGFRGASVDLRASERGGDARLALRRGSLVFPGVFDDPRLAFDELSTTLAWTIEPSDLAGGAPRVRLGTRDLRFANADARGSVEATWQTGAGGGWGVDGRLPGRLALTARIDQARADRVARYLPLGIPQATRDYLGRAVQGGRVRDAVLRVDGPLAAFPFFPPTPTAAGTVVAAAPGAPASAPAGARAAVAAAVAAVVAPLRRATPAPDPAAGGDGAFSVRARVEDGRFAYVPDEPAARSPWPAIDAIDGELRIDRASLAFDADTGRIGGVRLAQVRARIADMAHGAHVEVDGRASGAAAALLGFVAATPVRDWTSRALDGFAADGDATLHLALDLPLEDLARTRVDGRVELGGNDLTIGPDIPRLTGARGQVTFSEHGFSVRQATARAVGGELTVDGGSQPDGSVRLRASGTATAEGLRATPELGFVTRVADALQGAAPYQVQVDVAADGARTVTVGSTLAGVASALPAPLRKPAAAELPLKVEIATPAAPPGATTTPDQLRVQLGDLLNVRYQRAWQGESVRVTQGWLGIGAAAGDPVPDGLRGVVARVRLPAADLDAWRAELDRVFPDEPAAAPTTPSATAPAPAGDAGGGYAPQEVRVAVDELRLFGRPVHAVQAQWQPVRGGWRAEFRAREGEGSADWRADAGGERLRARLARLDLAPPVAGGAAPSGAAAAASAPAASPAATPPAAWAGAGLPPALDVVVDDLWWKGRRVGRVELDAAQRATAGGAREWRVQRLALTTPEARLIAQGPWLGMGAQGPALGVRIEVADSGDLLERLGSGRAIRGGRGTVAGDLAWTGSPLVPDFATLSGRLTLALDGGQFLKADPGAGRLLGVLSLQALPRRLVLDFRDVFQEGFAFDSITGDVTVAAGVARTNNLRMRGVQAAVLMDGQADLRAETQDLRVVVVPDINAGTASLAYAAINPAVGLGTFLAQLFLRRPLAAAGTREFHVTGSWSDPRVARVDRTPPPPSADLADGPTAPAGPTSPAPAPAAPAAPAPESAR